MPFGKKTLSLKLGIALLLLLLAGLVLFVIATRQRQEFRKEAAYSGPSALTLTPSKTDVYPGEDVSFLVSLNPGLRGTAKVKSTGVEIHVSYDQAKIENVRIQNLSPIFSEIKQNIANGKIDFATGINPATTPPTFFENASEVARVSFKVKDATVVGSKIPFSFYSSDTQDVSIVTEYQVDTNVLGAVAPQTLEFNVVQRPTTMANIIFKIKFQGVTSQAPNQNVSFLLEGGNPTGTVRPVTSDVNGVFTGRVDNLPPATYNISIKGPYHLRNKFTGVALNVGDNTVNWTATVLKAGDAYNDNIIDIQDFAVLRRDFTKTSGPADFNFDGVVDITDFGLLRVNFGNSGN